MQQGAPVPDSAPYGGVEALPVARIRAIVRIALGALWILDGLLQLRPGMFQLSMLHNVIQLAGQPPWLAAVLHWALGIMTPHVTVWHLLIVVVQLLIGTLLLTGRHARAVQLGLWLSVVWTAVVWLFGEGLGGVLTGDATILTGAPGSVLLYGWIAFTLLLPARCWKWGRGVNVVRRAPAVFFGLAALQQLVPVFWQPRGLASQLRLAGRGEPDYLRGTMVWTVSVTHQHPILSNLVLVVAMGFVSWRLFQARPGPAAYLTALAFMIVVWWFGEGLGTLFSRTSTDLNTMPVLALMILPGWLAGRMPSGRGLATPPP